MALQQLRHLDRSSSKFHDQLSNVFNSEVYQRSLPNLNGNELVSLIDYLDKALDSLDPASPGFRKCLRELRNICGTRLILPTSYVLSPSLLNIGRHPIASGGPADVYEGTLRDSKVCVKRVRVYSKESPGKATKTLYQEAVVWKRLDHQNIVPLLGITFTPLQLISEWMPNGNLTEYIRTHPETDRLELLRDITDGLHHLHSRNVVHGDLKGPNILVDATGRARITDFGLATVTRDPHSVRSASGDQAHTARWTAPEILTGHGTYSKEADIFSFAMVTIEVFTGAVPFGNSPPAAAMVAIMDARRPSRPTHSSFTEGLWELTQRCWHQNPQSRPGVSEVLEVVRGLDTPPPGGQLDRRVSRRTSRRDPATSEPPRTHIDPQPFDSNRQQKGQARNQVYSHTGGAGTSRSNLQDALGGRNTRDVTGKGSRLDLNQGLDENDERKYWSGSRRDNRGASRSALNVGDRYDQGDQSPGPSRTYAKALVTPPDEPRTVTTGRSMTTASRKHSARGTLSEASVDGGTVPYRIDHPRPEPTSPGRLPGTGSPLPSLGNDPIEEIKPARVLSNRELRELRKKEKKTKELGEKSQREEKRKELEREKAEKEAQELQERLEEEKRRKELERTEREARELKERLENEQRRKELERQQEEQEARELKEKHDRERRKKELEREQEKEAKEKFEREARQRESERREREARELKERRERAEENPIEEPPQPTERTSRRDTTRANAGYATRNTSRRDLRTGNESRNQSRTDLSKSLPKNHEPPLPQTRQQQESRGPNEHAGASNPQMNSEYRGEQGHKDQNGPGGTLYPSKPPAWKRLINPTLTPHERISLIMAIFSDQQEVEMVRHLCGDDAQSFVDFVDEVLDSLPSQIRKRCARAVYRLCGRQAMLPRSLTIPLCYDPNESPMCHGGFADVWKGKYRGREVAAKVLRIYSKNDPERIRKRFCREVAAWKTLRHPNVLPLLGATMNADRLVMVSEWMANGNIDEYLQTNTNADRLGLLRDVAEGLIYMHDQGIVHGDLKGANILVDRKGHACLADFSLLTVVPDQSTIISSSTSGGTVQWMSPELLHPALFGMEASHPTKESDCYALGMVVYEVLSRQAPFAPAKAPVVIWMVLEGKRPERPQGEEGRLFTDSIWGVLQLCWKPQPSERTNVEVVFRRLGGKPSQVRSTSSAVGDAETDSENLSDATVKGPLITYGKNVRPGPPPRHPNTVPDPDPNPPTRRGDAGNPAPQHRDRPDPVPNPPTTIIPDENTPPTPPRAYPPKTSPPGRGELLDPPQQDGSEGWFKKIFCCRF